MFRRVVIGAAVAISLLGSAALSCELSLGVVPQFEHRRILAAWTPVIERLETATGCTVRLRASRSIPEFEDEFQSGSFDIVYMNPFHAVMAHDEQNYLPIIRSGARKLQGILVVAADSEFQDVKDLDGQELAFPSPNALGASLLMRAELTESVGISYTTRYVGTHTSVYLNVYKQLVAAGGGVQRSLSTQDPALSEGLRVIYRTQQVPAHPIAIHPRVGSDHVAKITAEILKIGAENPELLERIPLKQPIETNIDEYAALRDMGLEKFRE
ncbi:phosphate/phosphite/phosphonate ABC transporter substrate-binding protein [Thalassococcus lentus]|uniref:Phosphate/phosphite/phosphonate ABC transporter substrate-binding protein n=1 Tax=Thalassococcus lentus TaxID=1210524 RepID=A0ABT4XS04_9RHOB|nr:phosphate/phosphite/phosphonate ABC transporter substrate-binding protein [Thalassococcus lentus]MDA7424733.1 phosphate/phosphite/phosphonate ABC transporter substrate-binding protein [Thalassococcus lentus]